MENAVFLNDDILTAEVLEAMKVVVKHFSCNSCEGLNNLYKRQFHDSEIAKHFRCGPDKCSYLITFGLAPFYRDSLIHKVSESNLPFVILFDESLNDTLQKSQMDLIVRFWDSEKKIRSGVNI